MGLDYRQPLLPPQHSRQVPTNQLPTCERVPHVEGVAQQQSARGVQRLAGDLPEWGQGAGAGLNGNLLCEASNKCCCGHASPMAR